MNLFLRAVEAYELWALVYLFTINTIYFCLTFVGFLEMLRYRFVASARALEEPGGAGSSHAPYENSVLVQPVSIIAPAYNEAATVCESVRAMLGLRYPEFEVVVVNDGSKDRTLELLIEHFHLYRSARYYEPKLASKGVRAVYESMDGVPLVVVDKENGGKADSLNAGINVSKYPLFCCVDSDSLLERDALLRIAEPLIEDPDRVLAVGGIIRVANGCEISNGSVATIGLPDSWIARFQVVEYFRAFLGGRVALSSLNSLLVISGAFGLFQKAAVITVGGYSTKTVGEDMELVVRLHRWAREQKRQYKIVFQPDPVCWTEVPESLKILKRQRNRWQRGTIETIWRHRKMIGNPRFGLLGLTALPYFVAFEMLGPLVEITGLVVTAVGAYMGVIDKSAAYLFFAVSVLYGMLLSTASILLEELSTHRYSSVGSLLTLIVCGVLENLGFRQLMTLWRAQAFIDVWRGKGGWGAMERKGFQPTSLEEPVQAAASGTLDSRNVPCNR